MLHNGFEILKKDGKKCNHLKHMWLFISGFKVPTLGISKYVKLAKLAMCQVLGFVDDEHCFNILSFVKGTFYNHSSPILMCVRMFSQNFYNLESFP
jgi:hypothetical protein